MNTSVAYLPLMTIPALKATLNVLHLGPTRDDHVNLESTSCPCPLNYLPKLYSDRMFKKPLAHQSNATPLRSSARRQLLVSITGQYPHLIPTDSDNGNDGTGTGAGVSAKEVGKLVLPEGVRTTTFETSGGVEGVSLLTAIWKGTSNGLMGRHSGRIQMVIPILFGCLSVAIPKNSSQLVSSTIQNNPDL